MRQLARPRPFDLDEVRPRLAEYKGLSPRWQAWGSVLDRCRSLGVEMAQAVASRRAGWTDIGWRPMIHRHLTHRRHTLAALDDMLENGTLADWRPVLVATRRDPGGDVALRLDRLLLERDYGDSGDLWRAYLSAVRRGSSAT